MYYEREKILDVILLGKDKMKNSLSAKIGQELPFIIDCDTFMVEKLPFIHFPNIF